jgi:hypothetical protein
MSLLPIGSTGIPVDLAKSAHGSSQANTVNDGEIGPDLKPRTLRELLEHHFLGVSESLALENTMTQVDPWEKAADCERALKSAVDPAHRHKLKDIREFWISLAYARPFITEQQFAKEAHAKT